MPRQHVPVLLAVFAALPAARADAQQPPDSAVARPAAAQPQDTSRAACAGCPRRRPVLAAIEVGLINVVVNRVDAWPRHQDWAYVGPSDWSRNLRLGWEWDEDEFGTNMFAHPYHGGLYFNAARSNGLGYWEAAPLAFLGSFTWEYFGESFRPSLNDFFMTSFGGIALGEVFHRVGTSIRDHSRRGGSRAFREVAALPFDPMGGINRLFRGDWSRVGPNPPEHDPEAFVFRVGLGARASSDTGATDTLASSATIVADLSYGDRYLRPYRAPFDVFAVRAQVSPGGGGINTLRATGRLYGRNINRQAARNRHLFEINQRYDYVNNPASSFGAQSVEGGIASRWQLGKGYAIRSDLFLDFILLGALDAPFGGAGKRTYDFGPGVGLRFDLALERRGITYLLLVDRAEYVHSVSGAEADHFLGFSALEISLPITRGVGIALHAAGYTRVSRYSDQPEARRDFPEARLLLTWTTSGRRLTVPAQ